MAVPIAHFPPTLPLSSATPRNFISKFNSKFNSFTCQNSDTLSHLSTTPLHFSVKNGRMLHTHFCTKASASPSVENAEYTEEPATKVTFLRSVDLPGCSSPLSLVGTGYREKVFAFIGVKVYAAGLYMNPSLLDNLTPWRGKSAAEIEQDLSVFQSVYQSALEKSLQIVLVRDVDGKTFWDALDEAVSPRVTTPTQVDQSALSTFRKIFQGRSLKKGTSILLTWLEPSKMLASVSENGLPEKIDDTIESMNVTRALFDVFFGESPVSSTLKTSVASGLARSLQ